MMHEQVFLGERLVGLGATDPETNPPRRPLSPLLTFPAGGAAIGGLIGYAIKRNAKGAAVGGAIGAAAPFALAAVIIASGWRP